MYVLFAYMVAGQANGMEWGSRCTLEMELIEKKE
jgi:hypothetical protein